MKSRDNFYLEIFKETLLKTQEICDFYKIRIKNRVGFRNVSSILNISKNFYKIFPLSDGLQDGDINALLQIAFRCRMWYLKYGASFRKNGDLCQKEFPKTYIQRAKEENNIIINTGYKKYRYRTNN